MSAGLSNTPLVDAALRPSIFLATPPRLFYHVHRVLRRIHFNLRVRSRDDIDAQLVADADHVEQHISDFCSHFIECFRRQLLAFGFGEPLKMLERLAGAGAKMVSHGFAVGHVWVARSRLAGRWLIWAAPLGRSLADLAAFASFSGIVLHRLRFDRRILG